MSRRAWCACGTICYKCQKRPAVCEAQAAAGQEYGSTFLCAQCADQWIGCIYPIFPICAVCHTRPSVDFIASPEEETLPSPLPSPQLLFWRSLTNKETFALWAKRHYFCQECTHGKPLASPWTSDNGTTKRFVDYVLKKDNQGKVDNESTQIG